MNQRPYILTLVLLPLCTLIIGWQLGQRAMQMQLPTGSQQSSSGTTVLTQSGVVVGDPENQVDLSLLWNVWRLLQSHYLRPEQLNAQTMVYGAIHGLVASIGDPYTLFMDPQENTDFHDQLSGELEGIGAELLIKDGDVTVVSTIKNSPAEHAGLLPMDIITQVNGQALATLTLDDVVAKIRGKKGTSVTLTVQRGTETKPWTFTIVRDTIQVPSVEYEVKKTPDGNIGLLTINEFGSDTIPEATNILSGVKAADLKGLIIDLRYNGGGYLDGAVSLSSLFLPDNTKVVSVQSREGPPEEHFTTGTPLFPTIPMAILVNDGTASASEIVAGALQDHKRATIIGVRTFGKGTVQEVIDLDDGSSLRVTIARWLTPNGHDLGKIGVTPDIIVDRSTADLEANRDPQLQTAELWLTQHKIDTSIAKTSTGATTK